MYKICTCNRKFKRNVNQETFLGAVYFRIENKFSAYEVLKGNFKNIVNVESQGRY